MAPRALSQQEWAEIMARFVTKIGRAAHEAYEELHNDPEQTVKEPIQAEPFAAMVADGLLGMLTMLNDLNKKEARNGTGVEEFDVVQLFTQELFVRLSSMGYTTCVDQQVDPKAYEQMVDAIETANTPPEGTSKH